MRYFMAVGIDGYVGLEVDAESMSAAIDKANDIVSEMDFGQLTDIQWRIIEEASYEEGE